VRLALIAACSFTPPPPLRRSERRRIGRSPWCGLGGIIHPVSLRCLIGVIDQADAAGADVVVIVLRTPGGLLDSTRDIVSRMITSCLVAVFVGPSSGRAASAGFILILAADVAAMAPGLPIGAAHRSLATEPWTT
jgi:membrane-bound serine protease (ClpP class)